MVESTPEALYPIAILIDELKSDDLSYRVNSVKRLDTIAIALGPERTREELLPFLLESVDDEDEVLIALCEQLGAKFVPFVGGPEFAAVLLPPLEAMASVEESVVREKAVAALNQVVSAMTQRDVLGAAWPIAQRLGNRDWFVSRTSACGLLPRLYARLPLAAAAAAVSASSASSSSSSSEDGMDIDAAGNLGGKRDGGAARSRGSVDGPGGLGTEDAAASSPSSGRGSCREDALAMFVKLCGDDTPMVRRAAASILGDMGTVLAGGTLRAAAAAGGAPSSSAMDSETTAEGAAASLAAGGAAGGGKAAQPPSTSALLTRDGLNVDTGDINSTAVPLPVPVAIAVDAGTQAAGAAAAAQLLPRLLAFATDDQDSVRLLAVDDAVALARLVNGGMASVTEAGGEAEARLARHADVRERVVAVVLTLVADASWRVRWSVANRFSELCEALGRDITAGRLLHGFESLMGDGEAEVRSAASYRVTDVGRLLGRGVVQTAVLPHLNRLSEDPSEHVRAALASVVLGLAPVLGSESTIALLLPLFLRLLKDATPQVRLNLICKLEAVNAVIGLRVLSQSLLPAIVELSGDKQWRVRLAIIEFMPLLGAQLGAEFFDSELTALCVGWLGDPVHAIREAASANLRKLTDVFGAEWAERAIVPRILQLQHEGESNYLLRQTALLAAVTVGEALGPALLASCMLPAVVGYAKDPVPNIRFNLAKALERLAPKVDAATLAAVVKPTLQAMLLDPDADVKFYSARALAAF